MCNKLKNKNEIAIIEKYGSRAKYYTTAIIRKTMVVEPFICFKIRLNVIINIFVLNKTRFSLASREKFKKLKGK